jgi:hypothetical protein
VTSAWCLGAGFSASEWNCWDISYNRPEQALSTINHSSAIPPFDAIYSPTAKAFLNKLRIVHPPIISNTILDIIHSPAFCLKLNSTGLSISYRKHITSPLLAQQVNAIYRFWRWYINIIITILDIIHRPVFYLKHNVWETGFCPCLQVEPNQTGTIDRGGLCLRMRDGTMDNDQNCDSYINMYQRQRSMDLIPPIPSH